MFGKVKTKNLYILKVVCVTSVRKTEKYDGYFYEYEAEGKVLGDEYFVGQRKEYQFPETENNGHESAFILLDSETKVMPYFIKGYDEVGVLIAKRPVFIGNFFQKRKVSKKVLRELVAYINNRATEKKCSVMATMDSIRAKKLPVDMLNTVLGIEALLGE